VTDFLPQCKCRGIFAVDLTGYGNVSEFCFEAGERKIAKGRVSQPGTFTLYIVSIASTSAKSASEISI
jgi:hypothetical protein